MEKGVKVGPNYGFHIGLKTFFAMLSYLYGQMDIIFSKCRFKKFHANFTPNIMAAFGKRAKKATEPVSTCYYGNIFEVACFSLITM
jgi:hypothetical protein